MKSLFKGYYPPSQKDFDEMWENGLFCFDANVLLNLYRYSVDTRNQFLKILRFLGERIWLPHQAGFEFHNNRLGVIGEQKGIFQKISKVLDKSHKDLLEDLGGDHISLDGDKILKIIERAFEKAKQLLADDKDKHPDLLSKDLIRDCLTEIFKDRVGAPYTEEKLLKIYEEGGSRYERKIPPGYKDNNKDERKYYGLIEIQSQYGDLLIWKQLIDKAKEKKCPFIFITDDQKEDWWNIFKGKTMGPRPELLTEFVNCTQQSIYFLKPTYFLEQAKKRYNVAVTKKTLDEVRAVSRVKIDWKELIIESLDKLGGKASLRSIYDEVQKTESSVDFPDSWKSCVRKAVYYHSSDVELYAGKEDLFEHVGKGVWALRSKNSIVSAEPTAGNVLK